MCGVLAAVTVLDVVLVYCRLLLPTGNAVLCYAVHVPCLRACSGTVFEQKHSCYVTYASGAAWLLEVHCVVAALRWRGIGCFAGTCNSKRKAFP
jgi:hypothetical protein